MLFLSMSSFIFSAIAFLRVLMYTLTNANRQRITLLELLSFILQNKTHRYTSRQYDAQVLLRSSITRNRQDTGSDASSYRILNKKSPPKAKMEYTIEEIAMNKSSFIFSLRRYKYFLTNSKNVIYSEYEFRV